ncbi:MAG: PD-(D/E)XK nuclease-like domain-containing protein, partial [Geminicoccaceae bacterium]
ALAQLDWLDMSGDRETVIITERDGFWRRSMCDILNTDERTIIDLKFTKIYADADAFGRHAYNMGYDIQDAHYRRNLGRVLGIDPNSVKFWFVCVECPPSGPVMTAAYQLEHSLQVIGKERHERGEAVWQQCLKTNEWPGYPRQIMTAPAPAWALNEHIKRHEMETEYV